MRRGGCPEVDRSDGGSIVERRRRRTRRVIAATRTSRVQHCLPTNQLLADRPAGRPQLHASRSHSENHLSRCSSPLPTRSSADAEIARRANGGMSPECKTQRFLCHTGVPEKNS